MLSVRGRDVRKGLELGLGFESSEEMDEPELEEGEACFYQEFDDNDYDPNVDLDVALSYIDDKLQDVLGHFQKDFEAGVTPQNLGAKFGDYGSFLPTYQRAPAWSHLRSPAKVDNHNLETSLSKSYTEGGVHMLSRHEEASVSNVAKRTEAKLFARVNVSSSKVELEKNYDQSSDQNIIKACTDIGSDNLSTQKMAKIYNTLGINLSPFSSLGDSPSNIKGNALKESPTRILQIMTSLPVDKNLLLSPLTEYLMNLTVKQKNLQREGKSAISQKVAKASPNALYSLKSDGHIIKEKKPKSSRKRVSLLQLKNLNVDIFHKKETDTDTMARENLAVACSKVVTNGGNLDINVQSKENSKLEEVKAVFSSQIKSNVLREIQAENAELFNENATCQEEEVQLPSRKEHSSSGRKKKPKGTRVHDKRDNSVPKKEKENPKANEDKTMAVNMYKDLFGEMELDEELDTKKNCSVDQAEDDMVTDKCKIAPNSATEKKLNVKKIDRQSMLETNIKSALNPDPISGAAGPLVASYKVPLLCEVDKKNGTKETNVQISQDDEARFVRSSKKKVQVTMNKRSLNGKIHSPPAKEVESALLRQPSVAEKHVDTKIENDKRFVQISSEGEYLSSDNNSKRTHDQNGYRVSKKIRRDGLPYREEDSEREKLSRVNGSQQIKSVNKSLLRAKEENENCISEIDKGKANIYDSGNESMDYTGSYETELVIKECTGSEGAKESTRSDITTKVRDNNGFPSNHDQKQNLCLNINKKSIENELDKTDRGEVREKGRSRLSPSSGRGRSEAVNHSRHLNGGEHKENGVNHLSMSTSEGDDAPEALRPKTNGITWRQSTANGHKVGDKDAPASGKRDSSSHTIIKEAKDLKHLADRLKSTGASAESTSLYFEAALKFLQGAFLLETCSGESAQQSDVIQSMQIYSSTGQLCMFCAQLYEKSKDMATAALAYKCMEVAYMRVIYSSRGRASRDCHELETASQIGPPGESPLSSASDIDNLNNLKADRAKSIVSPPQVAAVGNHVISAGNRPIFVRLLSYARDVNCAMEASRKCKIAYAAANQRMEDTESKEEGIASVKRAIDFNFQDVDGLLRLVRLAMEAISH